jgi:O-acetylhomoserine (thiol)-lyase
VGTRDATIELFAVVAEGATYSLLRLGVCVGHSSTVRQLDWSVDDAVLQSSCQAYELLYWDGLRAEQLRDMGPTLAPHSAFLLAQGVETLPYRMQAHVDNTRGVAEWLAADKRVTAVNWAGLTNHPHFDRAQKYMPLGPGSVFSFEVAGGREVAQRMIESVNLASHVVNIGDAKTLIVHPASTTHAQLNNDQLIAAGVLPGVIRLSVGIEDVEDIIYDLDQALTQALKG